MKDDDKILFTIKIKLQDEEMDHSVEHTLYHVEGSTFESSITVRDHQEQEKLHEESSSAVLVLPLP